MLDKGLPQRESVPGASGVGWVGRLGAPVAASAVYLALGASSLDQPARATAAVGTLMAVLWMTEGLPLPATSLLPIVLFPLFGVESIRDAAAPYAHELIFLFMGGFLLALAMEKWGLHRRVALRVMLLAGTRPRALVGAFMGVSALLSMWISNSATAVMMLPIAVSVIGLVDRRMAAGDNGAAPGSESRATTQARVDRFAVSLLLGLAYGASVGGVGTIIGTPPNGILVSYLDQTFGVEIGFGQWMLLGVPFAAVMLGVTWALLTFVLHPPGIDRVPGGRDLIRDELRALGPVSRGEWTVFLVFILTASLWVFRKPALMIGFVHDTVGFLDRLTDAGVAMVGAVLLFAIPVNVRRGEFALGWRTAERLPWGVLLLFGGGLSLARAVSATGLDGWIGAQVGGLGAWPLWALVGAVVVLVIFLTELTSNTATAATFLPILGGVALGIGVAPTALVIPAAIAASCAFMMPVATPPNAIVFGSGRVRIGDMVRAGIILNIIGVVVITTLALTLGRWLLPAGG